MNHQTIVDDRTFPPAPGDPIPHEDGSEPLEQRVRRLEEAVVALQDTALMEDRLVERVLAQLEERPASPPALREAPTQALAALPLAPESVPHLDPESSVPGAVLVPTPPSTPPSSWLLVDFVRDARTIFRMYFDPRYRLSRTAQILGPILIGLFVASYLFFQHGFCIPGLSTILEKITDIALAVLLYKMLSREAIRYKDVLAHLETLRTAPRPFHPSQFNHDHDTSAHTRTEFTE